MSSPIAWTTEWDVGRLEEGQSQVQVTTELDETSNTVSNSWKQFQDTEYIHRRHEQGHRGATMTNEDHYLVHSARRHGAHVSCMLPLEPEFHRVFCGLKYHERELYARRPIICAPRTDNTQKTAFSMEQTT